MKKLLLLFAVTIAAAETVWADETVLWTYDYNTDTWSDYNVSYNVITTSNTVNQTYPTTYWNETKGYTMARIYNTSYATTDDDGNVTGAVADATFLMNFGGKVGTVWCLNGSSSGFQTYLNSNYNTQFGQTVTWTDADGNTQSSTVTSLPYGYQQGNFYMYWAMENSETTRSYGTSESDFIRVRMLINVFEGDGDGNFNSSDDAVFAAITGYYNGSACPSGTISGYEITSSEFVDEDGSWDPTKWLVYEFDFYANANSNYSRNIVVNPTNGSHQKYAIFIKKIEFIAGNTIDGASYKGATYYGDGVTKAYDTYTVNFTENSTTGITSVAADAAEPVYTVNGQNVTFEAGAQIYSITGALVDVAQPGETTTLAKGFYVARVGNKGVKFAVK